MSNDHGNLKEGRGKRVWGEVTRIGERGERVAWEGLSILGLKLYKIVRRKSHVPVHM